MSPSASPRTARTLLVLSLLACVSPSAFAACVSLTTPGSAYTQNFDTLSNTAGSTTNVLAINGWAMTETGGGARDNEQYAVDTGGSATGDTYSYGSAAATDRALGGLQSGTLIPSFGACFTNNTGVTITSLDIAYNGEEWRLGTTARTDQINFEYSTNATDLVTGTWTGVTALNFVTPDTGTTGAKDGNAVGERTAISGSVPALSIANGATFWIRWADGNASGADDGLAVDDFSLTPQGGVAASADLALSKTDAPDPVTAGTNLTYTITVTNNGPDTAANASWSDTLPAGTTFVSLVQDTGPTFICTTGATVSCSNASFAAGSAQFTLTVAVGAGVADGTVLSNTATISSSTNDGNPGNNSATSTTTVTASADVSVLKTASTPNAIAGDAITYTITVTNNGPSDAASVAVTDSVPSGTTFTSLTSPGGWSCTTPAVGGTGTVNCTNASVAALSGPITFTLAVTVGAAPPATIVNTATVTATTNDPNPANNTATATTSTPVGLQSFEVD